MNDDAFVEQHISATWVEDALLIHGRSQESWGLESCWDPVQTEVLLEYKDVLENGCFAQIFILTINPIMAEDNVAQIIVDSLSNAGVRLCFGIPGAKIASVFDAFADHPEIKLIVCRHEQNAVMMAAAVGRITGTAGVCLATSGPGASNLLCGLLTATTEGDPVVALIGNVPRNMSTKKTHQGMKAVDILGPACKGAIELDVEDQAAEVVMNAFRTSLAAPQGAVLVSIPSDIAKGKSKFLPFPEPAFKPAWFGPSSAARREEAARLIEKATLPVLLLGMRASSAKIVETINSFLSRHAIPVVETFQAAGSVSEANAQLWFGRVGCFQNQPGDKLLAKADLVITVGYDQVEYDAYEWNSNTKSQIIHIDYVNADYGIHYRPEVELLGSIRENLEFLKDHVTSVQNASQSETCRTLSQQRGAWKDRPEASRKTGVVHPLYLVSTLQRLVSKETVVVCDIGTSYLYMMRYYHCYHPRHLLCSNGQQTLGVGLPWAIAASLTQEPPCSKKVVSISGDGGFMFTSQEMSTAVQQGCNITHFIWNDGSFNMVKFQEQILFGRTSGVKLGGVDFVKFAETFGAKGYRVKSAADLEQVVKTALAYRGVALVDVPIDYADSVTLAQKMIDDEWN